MSRKNLTEIEYTTLRSVLERETSLEAGALEILLATGMRQSELVRIKACDFDDQICSISVRATKGSDSGEAPLKPETYARVARIRLELGRGTLGEAISGGNVESQKKRVRELWYQLCAEALGYKPTGVHGARHTYAMKLFESDIDTREVQMLMRHKSIASTAKYLTHLSIERLKPRALKVVG